MEGKGIRKNEGKRGKEQRKGRRDREREKRWKGEEKDKRDVWKKTYAHGFQMAFLVASIYKIFNS